LSKPSPTGKLPDVFPREGIFAERRSVFVTLHVRNRLQGCIGVIEANEPLGEAIIHCAASAALEDPRFAPMRTDQLAELNIEISLLSPMEQIAPESIEIGHHGLFVRYTRSAGCFSPRLPSSIG